MVVPGGKEGICHQKKKIATPPQKKKKLFSEFLVNMMWKNPNFRMLHKQKKNKFLPFICH